MRAVATCVILVGALGCAGNHHLLGDTARYRAASDLSCPMETIVVRERTDLSYGVYEARGCAKSVRYVCTFATRAETRATCTPESAALVERTP